MIQKGFNEFILDEKGNKPLKSKEIKYIVKNECWECISHSRHSGGYPQIGRNQKNISMHRYIYTLYNGLIPDKMVIMHKCDNRICINPKHLILGTYKDNVQDMHNKRRNKGMKNKSHNIETKKIIKEKSSGFNSKRVKLTEKDYFEIKNMLLNSKEKIEEIKIIIANRFNISKSTVSNIRNGNHWFSKNLGGGYRDWKEENK